MVHSTARTHCGKVCNIFWSCTNRLVKQETGGNEALPPGWQEYDDGHHKIRYQDDNLFLNSPKRPLPGVRLGERKSTTRMRALTAGHRLSWRSSCSRMGMAHLSTWSFLLRQPQQSNHIMEETNPRTSPRELDTEVHHQGSFQDHIKRGLCGKESQCNQCIGRWFNSPVDKRWEDYRTALEK